MGSPRYDIPKAAPPPLRLVQAFVNTLDVERGHDFLTNDWLREQHLVTGPPLGARALAAARRIREALRSALEGDPVPLDAVGRRVPLCARFGDYGSRLEPVARDLDHLAGILLAIAHDAQLQGTWQRLKTCRQCRWAFYDYSRNRSAVWCSMSICGNRRKTRSYRRRRGGEPR